MENISPKTRLVAGVLAWFLGTVGAHRFYVGRTGSAVAMLLLSATVVGLAITGMWAIIDFIIILNGSFKDKDGLVLKNWTNN